MKNEKNRKKFKKSVDKRKALWYNIKVADTERQKTERYGGIAQLARALGSYPGCRWFKSDCRYHFYGPLVKRLRHRPFTAESWVRFPYGSPQSLAEKSARFLFYVYCRFCLLKCMAVFRKSCKAKSALSGFYIWGYHITNYCCSAFSVQFSYVTTYVYLVALQFNLRNNLLLCKNPPTLKVSGF